MQQRIERDMRLTLVERAKPLRSRGQAETRLADRILRDVAGVTDVFTEIDDYYRHVTVFAQVGPEQLAAVEQLVDEALPATYDVEVFRVDADQMRRARVSWRVPAPDAQPAAS